MSSIVAVPTPEESRISDAAWEEAGWLPCRVTVELAVQGFTVGDLLSLGVGCVVATKTPSSAELMICVNGQLLGTAEVDVVGDRYAARLTGFMGQGN